jgi:hypothetical protein
MGVPRKAVDDRVDVQIETLTRKPRSTTAATFGA